MSAIDQIKAQRGKQVFEKNYVGCHHNIKRDDPARKTEATMIPISEIGTDPIMAMNIISRTSKSGILEGQPVIPLGNLLPDLDKLDARALTGIWASAPFLHNGSVPNLWELLQKPDQRVTMFNVGSWEIDPVKVGFVTDAEQATSEFNTTLPGNSNKGHEYGRELSDKEKWDLIEYIKTL